MRFISTLFKLLQSKLVLWLLEKYTHLEMVPLLTHGAYQVFQGDIAIINGRDFVNVGKVHDVQIGPDDEVQRVKIRLFRRPR